MIGICVTDPTIGDAVGDCIIWAAVVRYSGPWADHRKRGIIGIIGEPGNITPMAPGATIPDKGPANKPSTTLRNIEWKRNTNKQLENILFLKIWCFFNN